MASKVLILNFHRISDEVSPAYPPIPVKVFEKILAFLSRNAIVIPMEEIDRKSHGKKPRVVISFDDAFMDFYEYALPLLVKYQLPAHQSIITRCAQTGQPMWTQRLNKLVEAWFREGRQRELSGLLRMDSVKTSNPGKMALDLYRKLLPQYNREAWLEKLKNGLQNHYQDTPMMQWEQIRECMQYGVTMGSHTHTHQNLTLLTGDAVDAEAGTSVNLLWKHTGVKPTALAFPNGQYNQQVLDRVQKHGFRYLLTVDGQSFMPNSNTSKGALLVPRFNMFNTSWWKNHLKLHYYKRFR